MKVSIPWDQPAEDNEKAWPLVDIACDADAALIIPTFRASVHLYNPQHPWFNLSDGASW